MPMEEVGMTKLGKLIPQKAVHGLEVRTLKLAGLVETATQTSHVRAVREAGAPLIERLSEWMEEIKDLREVGDEEVNDLVESYHIRLWLAEKKVNTWDIPADLRESVIEAIEPTKKRRRGRPRKNKAA